jgi:TolA-binding protein
VDPAAKIYLAMLLIRAQREDEALAVLEGMPDLAGQALWMYRIQRAHLISKLYAERRQWDRALAAIGDALPLVEEVAESTKDFDNPPAICRVFLMRVEQVHDLYLRESDPARWLYKQYVLALASGDRKQQGLVKVHYQELLDQHPQSYWAGRAVFEHGLRTWEQGKEAEAASIWQKMIENDPAGPWRGHALLALADYRLALQLDFDAAQALYLQAWKTLERRPTADGAAQPDQTWQAVGHQVVARLATMLRVTGAADADQLDDVAAESLVEPTSGRQLASKELVAVLASRQPWLEPASSLVSNRAEGFVPRLTSGKAHFSPQLLDKLSRAGKRWPTPDEVLVDEHGAAGLLLALGDVALQLGQADQAHALFSRTWKATGVKVHPAQEEYAGRRLGEALIAQDKHVEAVTHLSQLARKRTRSDRPLVLLMLARLQGGPAGKPVEAFLTLAELLADYPQAAECIEGRYLLGQAFLAQRQWDQAVTAFEKLQAEHPDHPWSQEVATILLPLAREKGVRKLTVPAAAGPVNPANPPAKGPEKEPGKKGPPPKFVPFKA